MSNAFRRLSWASDDDYAAGVDPWSGAPTKVEPTTQFKTKGFTPEGPGSAQKLNWVINSMADTVTALGAAPALNFTTPATAALALLVRYSPFDRRWLGCDYLNNDKFVRTPDPWTWPSSTEISGGALNTEAIWDFNVDPDTGDILGFANGIDKGWHYDKATTTWVSVSGELGNDPQRPSIVYEPVTDRWVVAALRSGSGNTDFYNSVTGLTFTQHTKPSGWPSAAGVDVTLGVGDGKVVARATSGTNLYTSVSSDGGATWSAAVVTAVGFTPSYGGTNHQPAPIWTGSKWIMSVPDLSGPRTKIYSSVNGTSWTEEADLDVGIMRMAVFEGGALVLAHTSVQLIFSQDSGTTWQYSTRTLTGTITSMAASPCQFVVAANGINYPGQAAGAGLGAVT